MVEARICVMFLRSKICRKDGKDHRAWSVVENRRVHDGRVVQRQVLYLGEINDNQKAAWSKAIEVFDEGAGQSKQIVFVSRGRLAPVLDCDVLSIRLQSSQRRRQAMMKITPDHLARGAFIYIRQSTADQLANNQESRLRRMDWPIAPAFLVGPMSGH